MTVKLVLFDLDGTVYLSGTPFAGALDLMDKLRDAGLDLGYMTNNSSVGPEDYLLKLRNIGLKVDPVNIISSAEATTLMLADEHLGPDLFMLATPSFRTYLQSAGYRHSPDADTVLVGFDPTLDYAQLNAAVALLKNGAALVASHPDKVCPSVHGDLCDAGTTLAALEAATGCTPRAIAGKPHRWIVDLVCKKFGVAPAEILIVGDRLETDMAMGHAFGMTTVLTLSGVTDLARLDVWPDKPDVVIDTIADLIEERWDIFETA